MRVFICFSLLLFFGLSLIGHKKNVFGRIFFDPHKVAPKKRDKQKVKINHRYIENQRNH